MKKRIVKVLGIYLGLIVVFVAYYIISSKTGFYIPCIFNKITGYKCPGCGITHVLFDLINFKFKEAFMENPLVFIYLPFIVMYFLYQTYLYITDKKDEILVKIPDIFKISILVITILYGIVRNIIKI